MKFLPEKEVPERMRLHSPLPRPTTEKADPLIRILEHLTASLSTPPAQPSPVDLSPIVEAIQSRPDPPAPAKKWAFTIQRDEDGLMSQIIAERLE